MFLQLAYAVPGGTIAKEIVPMFAQAELDKLVQQVQLGTLCYFLGMAVVIMFALGVVLRTACSIYNGLAGGKDAADGVPMPSVIGAIGMVFLSFIITYGLMIAILWTASRLAIAPPNMSMEQIVLYAQLGATLLFFVVLSILMALFLPAPIFRTFIISILCVPVAIVLFVLLIAVIYVIKVAFNIGIPALEKMPWTK
jgi:hypothetical protein